MVNVSAVVTAHDEEEYIAGCLESILAQTHPLDEAIVIDDRSTDRTQEIVLRYPVKLYRVTFGDTYLAKREGIFLARNDVILSVDGDTILAKDFLARGLRHLEEGYKSATGYVYPHREGLINTFASNVCNSLPPAMYYSGPGYVLDRRAYQSSCKIVDLGNGYFVDHCQDCAEIPLDIETLCKDPAMVMYTDLPSTGQKHVLAVTGLATSTLGLIAISLI